MPVHGDAPVGAPIWLDLFTSHPETTHPFYCELFGWTVEAGGEDLGGYCTFSKGGVPIAGGMRNTDGAAPDFWTVYLATDDAQGVTERAVEAGGVAYVAPMAVTTLGTMVVLGDPGGATIGAWQPAQHRGFGLAHEDGAPGWFELHTRAYDEAVAFYRTAFLWDAHTAADEPGFRYTTLFSGDAQEAGIMDASAWLPEGAPAQWSVYFHADDADATIARAEALGAKVVQPAEDTPYGRLATLADPTGVTFKLVQPPG